MMKAASAQTVQVSAMPNSRNRPVAPPGGGKAQVEARAAGARASHRAKDHGRIERHHAMPEPLEMNAQPG